MSQTGSPMPCVRCKWLPPRHAPDCQEVQDMAAEIAALKAERDEVVYDCEGMAEEIATLKAQIESWKREEVIRDEREAKLNVRIERLVEAGDGVRRVHAAQGVCCCYLCAAWKAAKEG